VSNTALILAALLNFIISFGYLQSKNYGLVLTFVSYGVACLGFIWSNNLMVVK
jgi:hypothetical protein